MGELREKLRDIYGVSDNSALGARVFTELKPLKMGVNAVVVAVAEDCSLRLEAISFFCYGHRDHIACSLLGGFAKPRIAATQSLDSVLM